VLIHLKNKKNKFNVIIAEQDYEKTHDNIERMYAAGIQFMVVPAYMLSHLHDQIDMVFFGALTLKDTMNFVMNPGALSIISEFHHEKIPVYMFLGTEKFSLWKSKKRGEIFIHKHTRKHLNKPIVYERTKYSHDRVPSDLFKKIVTNEGVFTSKQIEKMFNEKYTTSNNLIWKRLEKLAQH
jgi:translation initiation factor 2B subunit (eIF-2B alpha/beta/delta family)